MLNFESALLLESVYGIWSDRGTGNRMLQNVSLRQDIDEIFKDKFNQHVSTQFWLQVTNLECLEWIFRMKKGETV